MRPGFRSRRGSVFLEFMISGNARSTLSGSRGASVAGVGVRVAQAARALGLLALPGQAQFRDGVAAAKRQKMRSKAQEFGFWHDSQGNNWLWGPAAIFE